MTGTTLRNVDLGAGWWRLDVEQPALARRSRPGQFVQVRIGEGDDPLIRRPFSVYRTSPAGPPEQATELAILYQVVGPGTRWMARLRPGDAVDLLGPLGRPFPELTVAAPGRLFLVGGGIGVAPLYFYARERLRRDPRVPLVVLLGARRRELLVGTADFEAAGLPFEVATDDGSAGFHGTVVELLTRQREGLPADQVRGIGCGPHGMNQALRDHAARHGLDFWISLENYMPCGFGACFGCVIPAQGDSVRAYRRVCVEGPAFPVGELPAQL